jgi:hypothetical protein
MADGRVLIDTAMDESGVDKGIVSLDKKLKGSTKDLGGFSSGLAKASIVGAGVAVALKKAADVIGDLTTAYKTQIKAETQLESAAKNNPYLTSSSVQALKDYASELQALTTDGDEELLPYMASLAAAGRTQDEIMQIMAASVDMAASGTFSLDGAVRNLNKSYGGLSGELGESIPEIKAFTAEELKNGAATKLMGERYKGIAAETAKATGTQKQLNNAVGDLKEEFGAGFEKGIAPIRRLATEIASAWASAKKAKREYYEDVESAAAGEANERGATALANEKLIEYLAVAEDYEAGLAYNSEETNKQLRERMELLHEEYAQLQSLAIATKYKGEEEKKAAKSAEKSKLEDKSLTEYILQATAARDKAIESIKLKAQADGVEVDEMEILNANVAAYVGLITESGGRITSNNALAKEWLGTIRDQTTSLAAHNAELLKATDLEDALNDAMNAINAVDDRDESVKMREQLGNLDTLYGEVMNNETLLADAKVSLWMEYADKRELLEKQITQTEAEEEKARTQASREKTIALLEIANSFATEYQNLMTNISELANQMIDDEATIKTDKLDKQYEAGEISLEEYEEKKTEIEQDAAKKRYKLQMWEWTANLATSIANTALGVTKALAQGGVAGIITGALVGAAGAVQLATIIGSKPVPPSFTTGGIMGGTSYTGDENVALLNSREMILNAGQQRNLFDSINSGKMGGSSVKIYNNAANDVHARATVTEDGIRVVINRTVAKSMADGKYNDSFRTMQNTVNGVRLTN